MNPNLALHAPLRVAIDLDGCIVNFNEGFIALIKEETGKSIVLGPHGPETWNYHMDAGKVTKQENEHIWWVIRTSPDFWARLQPYPNGVMTLEKLNELTIAGILDPYFITSRVGNTAKAQTVQWLRRWGMDAPQVLLAATSKHKGVLALGLGIEAALDDNTENVMAYAQAGAQSFVLDRLYNQPAMGNNVYRVIHPYSAVTAMATMAMERRIQ